MCLSRVSTQMLTRGASSTQVSDKETSRTWGTDLYWERVKTMTKRKRKRLTMKNFGAGIALLLSALGVLSQLGFPIAAPARYLMALSSPPVTYAQLEAMRMDTRWPNVTAKSR